MTVRYNPDAPVDQQPDDWSCSIESAQWLLRSLGRNPHDTWIRPQLLNNGLVTPEHGLMDASGRALVGWLQREYGDEMDLVFMAINPVEWDQVIQMAGTRPVMLGGRGWYHWSGVRRVGPDGLQLANPAPNWKGVGTVLSRDEWNRLGPWSAVTVYSRAEVDQPGPPIPPSSDEEISRKVRALLREALALLDAHLG